MRSSVNRRPQRPHGRLPQRQPSAPLPPPPPPAAAEPEPLPQSLTNSIHCHFGPDCNHIQTCPFNHQPRVKWSKSQKRVYHDLLRGSLVAARIDAENDHVLDPASRPSEERIKNQLPSKVKKGQSACKHWMYGTCRRGDKCWFKHDPTADPLAVADPTQPAEPLRPECCICYLVPDVYALFPECNHPVCIGCARKWRKDVRLNDNSEYAPPTANRRMKKKCPICRVQSKYVVPSSQFWTDIPGSSKKKEVIDGYKAFIGQQPCRFFNALNHPNKFCPLGDDCMRMHSNQDGSGRFLFGYGAHGAMKKRIQLAAVARMAGLPGLTRDEYSEELAAQIRLDNEPPANGLGPDIMRLLENGIDGFTLPDARRMNEFRTAVNERADHLDALNAIRRPDHRGNVTMGGPNAFRSGIHSRIIDFFHEEFEDAILEERFQDDMERALAASLADVGQATPAPIIPTAAHSSANNLNESPSAQLQTLGLNGRDLLNDSGQAVSPKGLKRQEAEDDLESVTSEAPAGMDEELFNNQPHRTPMKATSVLDDERGAAESSTSRRRAGPPSKKIKSEEISAFPTDDMANFAESSTAGHRLGVNMNNTSTPTPTITTSRLRPRSDGPSPTRTTRPQAAGTSVRPTTPTRSSRSRRSPSNQRPRWQN